MYGLATVKNGEAVKIRKLAESLNASIGNYQQAAQQATVHTLATFSGLQQTAKGLSENEAAALKRAREEACRLAEESTRKADEALAKLSADLSALGKEFGW